MFSHIWQSSFEYLFIEYIFEYSARLLLWAVALWGLPERILLFSLPHGLTHWSRCSKRLNLLSWLPSFPDSRKWSRANANNSFSYPWCCVFMRSWFFFNPSSRVATNLVSTAAATLLNSDLKCGRSAQWWDLQESSLFDARFASKNATFFHVIAFHQSILFTGHWSENPLLYAFPLKTDLIEASRHFPAKSFKLSCFHHQLYFGVVFRFRHVFFLPFEVNELGNQDNKNLCSLMMQSRWIYQAGGDKKNRLIKFTHHPCINLIKFDLIVDCLMRGPHTHTLRVSHSWFQLWTAERRARFGATMHFAYSRKDCSLSALSARINPTMRHAVDVHFPLGNGEPLDAVEEVFQCGKRWFCCVA